MTESTTAFLMRTRSVVKVCCTAQLMLTLAWYLLARCVVTRLTAACAVITHCLQLLLQLLLLFACLADCCAICCCEYEAGQPVIELSCRHVFHKECITAWLKVDAVCPICKTNLLPAPINPCGAGCNCQHHQSPADAAAAGLQAIAAAAPAPSTASAAAGATPVGVPVRQLHALGSPMLGVAGVSP